LTRLEHLSKRVLKAERKIAKGKKATLIIAKQMETDELRINKHSRVLIRLRRKLKQLTQQVIELRGKLLRSRQGKRKSRVLRPAPGAQLKLTKGKGKGKGKSKGQRKAFRPRKPRRSHRK